MNTPPPRRRVSLRLASSSAEVKPMPAQSLELLLARARELGVPLHHDAQIAALLAALRLHDDIPVQLYAAAASVLATIYDAAGE
ncbi:MAG: flagellar biosynthesis protein [Rhodanobacter sp.]|nr:MAG: flagellar biosynthesis protein [Rhodanobacter sp.]TAL99299.1 MAG: flagellar biosynthesis protein [Rhodanobacter sp.]TAM41538.1 MAG: flagellar biosynthesis protein [Rhodanobacter sp.]TAN28354.1 MAG: flagellar biosynthesis protein [Rhodanobacter sp.]